MQIKWSDIDHSDSPGEYKVNDKLIRVQKSDVDFWKEQPSAVFNIMDARFNDGGIGHVLVLANEDDQPSRSETTS